MIYLTNTGVIILRPVLGVFMKKAVSLLLIFVTCVGLFAENKIESKNGIKPVKETITPKERDYEPEKLIEIEAEDCAVLIEADVSDCEVYLNGMYQGLTKLEISGLLPGSYKLELRKKGYVPSLAIIRVRSGYDAHYKIHMEKIVGYIHVYDVPANATVSVSNSESVTHSTSSSGYREYTIATAPGSNEVRVRCFGYEDYFRYVDVYAFEDSSVYVELEPAEFRLTDFEVSKDSFNPEYNGRLGECEITFKVTNDGQAKVAIYDSSDNEIWSEQFDSFSTWNQSCSWNGTDASGNKVADGSYRVNVTSGTFVYDKNVKIDRSIVYPVLTTDRVGLGAIGNVPVAFKENSNFILLSTQDGLVISDGYVSADVGAGLLINFAKHFELGCRVAGFPGFRDEVGIQGAIGFKWYDSVALGSVDLCYGALIRYGGCGEGQWYLPQGVDCGNGLGAGGMVGLNAGKVYIGYACQYLIGSTNGILSFDDTCLNNSLCLSVKPTRFTKVGLWGSYFLNNCVDVGGEVCIMPESSAFIFNVKGDALINSGDGLKLNVGIGLSYLF